MADAAGGVWRYYALMKVLRTPEARFDGAQSTEMQPIIFAAAFGSN